MTIDISANAARVTYSLGAGSSQQAFTVSFEFFEDSDLKVYVDNTLKSISTHYAVSGGSGSTGTVTFGSALTGITGGSKITITRATVIERTTDFSSGADINRAALNTQLDTITAIAADNRDRINRTMTVSDFEVPPSLVLPSLASRKGTVLGFNSSTGSPEAGPSIATVQSLSEVTASINLLGTSAAVQDIALLGVPAVIEDMGLLATSATIADLAMLATSAIVADLAILATNDVVSDMNTLGTSDVVNDLNVLGTSANVTNMATLGASGVVGAIANVSANINSVNGFDDKYRIGSSDPSSALDEGDLFYNTTANVLKVYNGSAWEQGVTAGSGFLALSGGTVVGALRTTLATEALIFKNDDVISANLTIEAGKNSASFGPITVANGVTVTIPDNATYVVI